jgi:hypothetical protein
VLAANSFDWHADFNPPKKANDLLFAGAACSHGHPFLELMDFLGKLRVRFVWVQGITHQRRFQHHPTPAG